MIIKVFYLIFFLFSILILSEESIDKNQIESKQQKDNNEIQNSQIIKIENKIEEFLENENIDINLIKKLEIKDLGFRKRMKTKAGRNVLKRRRLKNRKKLSA